jgi:hypothetical protein
MATKALVCCVVLLALLGVAFAADKSKAVNEMDVEELRTEVIPTPQRLRAGV